MTRYPTPRTSFFSALVAATHFLQLVAPAFTFFLVYRATLRGYRLRMWLRCSVTNREGHLFLLLSRGPLAIFHFLGGTTSAYHYAAFNLHVSAGNRATTVTSTRCPALLRALTSTTSFQSFLHSLAQPVENCLSCIYIREDAWRNYMPNNICLF
ncbi:hypothetical protein F5Y10DRAFT_221393 [Nemania abortiva]|nr:hypothetical protein F5Y10DRAFT_221393 [Nemania abortiva]